MPKITPLRVIGGAVVAGILVLVAAWLVLAALVAWCSPHFDRSDLVGVYVAEYPTGTETLTLKPDGTFLQEVVLKEPLDSTPITRVGPWVWDESEQRLRLANCMAIDYSFGRISATVQTAEGGCSYTAERKWWYYGQLLLDGHGSFADLSKVD